MKRNVKKKCGIVFLNRKGKREWLGPGRAIKQSEWRAISAFLWCMLSTGLVSPTVSPVICNFSPKKLSFCRITS